MKNSAIFATCAENNQEYYIDRVITWYNLYYPKFGQNTDFYIFVDGQLTTVPQLDGCEFIQLTPKLGRSSIVKFEGYKRSFAEALKFLQDYEFITLCETDVRLCNFDKLEEYRFKNGLFSSIDERHHFIETAFMILNDKNARLKMMQYFLQNYDKDELFEFYFQYNYNFNYVFTSIRDEGLIPNKNYDYICQTNLKRE